MVWAINQTNTQGYWSSSCCSSCPILMAVVNLVQPMFVVIVTKLLDLSEFHFMIDFVKCSSYSYDFAGKTSFIAFRSLVTAWSIFRDYLSAAANTNACFESCSPHLFD